MRLRLFERLGRLVGWRFGSQGDGRSRDTRTAGTEAGGRHRRNVDRDRVAAGAAARSQVAPPGGAPAQ